MTSSPHSPSFAEIAPAQLSVAWHSWQHSREVAMLGTLVMRFPIRERSVVVL
jgi:hypothetical protein